VLKEYVFSDTMKKEAISMNIRGNKYSFMGTFCAIIVILMMFFLSKYVFKNDETEKSESVTESTYEYPAVEAEFALSPTN
jgi:hypothetical protein